MAVVVSQAAGCTVTVDLCGDGFLDVGEQCDDGDNLSGDGCSSVCLLEGATITANWSFKNEASGAATSCPVGFDTAALYSQPVDSNNVPIGTPAIDLFDCVDMSGFTDPLVPDVYASWIAITNTNNTSTYAESTTAIVDVIDVDKTYSATILNDGGYFELAWNLTRLSNGAAVTCAQANASAPNGGVEAVVTVSGGSAAKTDQWDCEDHYGLTGGFLQGSYTVSVDAFSSAGAEGTAPALTNRLILDRNRITDLGTITIPIDAL